MIEKRVYAAEVTQHIHFSRLLYAINYNSYMDIFGILVI